MSGAKVARCPKCRGRVLSIREVLAHIGETDYGEVLIDDGDALVPPSGFWFEQGDPIRVELTCDGCGHEWRSRRPVGSSHRDDLPDGGSR